MNITPIANQQVSKRITIPANAQHSVPFIGSFVAVLSTTGTVDILVSMDNGSTTKMRAGSGVPCVKLTEDGRSLEPAIFRRITFENTLDVPVTIEYLLSLGESTIPVVINDTVQIESSGIPAGRDPVNALIAGTQVQISADAKAIEIQPDGGGVIVCDADGKSLFKVGDLDDVIRPYTNCTLILKGDGADVSCYVSEIQ